MVQRKEGEQRMMKRELPGRRTKGRPQQRFMGVVRECIQMVGVTEDAGIV